MERPVGTSKPALVANSRQADSTPWSLATSGSCQQGQRTRTPYSKFSTKQQNGSYGGSFLACGSLEDSLVKLSSNRSRSGKCILDWLMRSQRGPLLSNGQTLSSGESSNQTLAMFTSSQ